MLELKDITKTFSPGSINEKLALDQLSFLVAKGEFVTIIGSNGAGKTTLLNCISGVYEVDQGRILIDGLDITFMPEYKRSKYIGRVFQDPLRGTAFNMTIEENLAIAYGKNKHRGLAPGFTKTGLNLFREHLSQLGLGLENRMKQKVGLLSAGQRQALTLLMATLVKPKLLLLDEHTAALDPSIAKIVLELTSRIVDENKLSALMVTHNLKTALEYGTRTIMMHEGRAILDLSGPEREQVSVEQLIEKFGTKSGQYNDRLLLS
ncbi:MAG TPA: ATP-binding cassette domain-containing protein [Firmicutes bacterium]|nr:ATP-binding cassette domain-containing protein [Bacillota bacterium]